ncbi:phage tail protein [Kribbella sp. NBC_01505]|uniref:phage tail protein n=1 Tax=Kribbella sp. NBC_01505 TaxID=2903580 RepID=UPI003865657F
MSRRVIEGLASPYPMLDLLPGIYAEDRLTAGLLAALDEVLAPIVLTLDNLPAYLDPALTPADFLPVLASWVAAFNDPDLEDHFERDLVTGAITMHRKRGTADGLAGTIELACGIRPEIEESGGTAWSAEPGAEPPGSSEPRLVVRLQVPETVAPGPDLGDVVTRIVEGLRPANLPARVELSGGTR